MNRYDCIAGDAWSTWSNGQWLRAYTVLFACGCCANGVERRAGTDGQGVMTRSAEAEARRTFGNLEDAELLTRAVVDIDLAAGDVDISICIRDYSGSAAFGKRGRGQVSFSSRRNGGRRTAPTAVVAAACIRNALLGVPSEFGR